MRAGPVRLLSLAWCLGTAAALLGPPPATAALGPVSLAPSPDTARFLACMRGAPKPPQRAAVPAAAGASGPVSAADPSPAASPGPTVLYCLSFIGYPDRPPLVAATMLCLQRSGALATLCLNRVFAALNPVVAGLPTAVPTPTATPVPATASPRTSPPKPTPTPVVVAAATPSPTRKPTARPTVTPRPTVPPRPTVRPLPTPRPTPRPPPRTAPPRIAPPRPTSTATPPSTPKPTALPSPRPARTPPPSSTAPTPRPTATPAGTPSAVVIAVGTGAAGGGGSAGSAPGAGGGASAGSAPGRGSGGPGPPITPLLVGGAALVVAAFAIPLGYYTRRRRAPHQKEPQMHQLEIVTPREASIAVAGRPVTFTARTDPPQLAAGVRWSVATQPGEPGAHGIGPAFTFTFGATGVEQVVAHLDDAGLTCDVVVYVFKTRTGGTALADLLRSEPPPVARAVESLRRWGASSLAPRRAS